MITAGRNRPSGSSAFPAPALFLRSAPVPFVPSCMRRTATGTCKDDTNDEYEPVGSHDAIDKHQGEN